MKSIVVDGIFYRSVKAYADLTGQTYNRMIIDHVNAFGKPYFFNGKLVRLATETEAECLSNGEPVGSPMKHTAASFGRSTGYALIPHPITVGISTNWGGRA